MDATADAMADATADATADAECAMCGERVDAPELERRLVSDSHAMARCACGAALPAALICALLGEEARGRVREERARMAAHLAAAALPAALPALKSYRASREVLLERDALDRDILRACNARDALRREMRTAAAAAARLGAAASDGAAGGASEGVCPAPACAGELVAGECARCGSRACARCGEPQRAGHECVASAVLSLQAVAAAARPCPRCAVPIVRSEGCPQMFCTRCSTKFNWDTGAVVSDNVFFDNPYYAMLRVAAAAGLGGARRSWRADLARARDRLGASRAARVLFCVALRQAMHLAEFLGPSSAPAWESPFQRRDRTAWRERDLEPGDQPGAVSCRGKARARADLTAQREALAAGAVTEAVFKRRVERLERRDWLFSETTRALAAHVAGMAEVAAEWLDDPDLDALYADTHSTSCTALLAVAAKADRVLLDVVRALAGRTFEALAGLHSLRKDAAWIAHYTAPLDFDARLENDRSITLECTDHKGCQRHQFRPARWAVRVRQTRDQIAATLAEVDLVAQPRGPAALVHFDAIYASAFNTRSRRAPQTETLLGRALHVRAEPPDCRCLHCTIARSMNELRRGASAAVAEELAAAEEEAHETAEGGWECLERARSAAAAAHLERFP
jgi:hypothetical protein